MATKEHSSKEHPDLPNKPNKTNWVERAGGLPPYMARVAKHIMYDSGYTETRAIKAAISQTKKRAAEGNKEAIAAVARWEKMKAGTSKVKLSVLPRDGVRQRQFTEQKHVRNKGRFAPKGTSNVRATNDSPQAIISGLKVGQTFDIPGLDGKIKRTDAGFVVTGPDGFTTTASTVSSAMAVAARLIRNRKGGKK